MKAEIQELLDSLEAAGYIADAPIATAVFLARTMRKPLLVEGDAGVGKTELAKVLARLQGTELIRLQCYEGLDVQTALYEWDYPRQLLRLRMGEGRGEDPREVEHRIFSREYLLERPLLRAITHADRSPVLLVDEIDRADDGFEAFLLELLSDFQVTIPELGTIRAALPDRGEEAIEGLEVAAPHLEGDAQGTTHLVAVGQVHERQCVRGIQLVAQGRAHTMGAEGAAQAREPQGEVAHEGSRTEVTREATSSGVIVSRSARSLSRHPSVCVTTSGSREACRRVSSASVQSSVSATPGSLTRRRWRRTWRKRPTSRASRSGAPGQRARMMRTSFSRLGCST